MSTLNPEEIGGFIQSAFATACQDPKFVNKLKSADAVIKVITSDPKGVLVMDMSNQQISMAQEDDPADATLFMKTDLANRFWQGKVNMVSAITFRKVRMQGSLPALMRTLPMAMELFPLYIDAVKQAGRTDLIVDK